MNTIDEVFATISDESVTANIDEILIIDPNTRQINIPGSELIFGVESDTHAERKYFQCPRYISNNIDLASCFIRVNYRNANGQVDSYLVDDVLASNDTVTFSWELSRKVTQYKGQVRFIVCACKPGEPNVEWNTTLATGMVLEGVEPNVDGVTIETSDVVAQLISMVERQTKAVEAEGTEQIERVTASAEATETAVLAEIEAKGTNTLASIPDDYTTLGNSVEALSRTRAPGIVCEAEGETIVVSDASDMAVQNLRVFGKSTQDGVPTPDAPVEIKSVESPTVSIDDQILPTTHTLHGIPVASGGNYTDSDGQQWICDEIDFERGVYARRVCKVTFDDFGGSVAHAVRNGYTEGCITTGINIKERKQAICSHFMYAGSGDAERFVMLENGATYFNISGEYDQEEWRTVMERMTPTVYAILATPIETPLTETEISAFRKLHTNKPNTTIFNDKGAHMNAEYVADTKIYIDNKLTSLLK